MGFALLVYQVPLSLVLLAAIVLRPDAWALLYLPGFLLMVSFFPHELLTLQRPIVRAVSIYISVVSLVEFLAHTAYLLIWVLLKWDLERDMFSWFKYFGLVPVGYLDAIRYLAPPLVLFILSVIVLVAIDNRNFYPVLPPARDKPSSIIYKFLIWISMLLASVSTPSLISLGYFVTWICMFLAKGVFKKDLSMKKNYIWTPVYLYTALNLVARLLAQQWFLFDLIPYAWRAPIGLQHYTQLEVDWNGLGVVVGWVSSVVLYWTLSIHRRNNLLGRLVAMPQRSSYNDEQKNYLNRHPMKKFFIGIKGPIQTFLVEYGRYGMIICCVIMFVMWPAYLSYGLFIVIIVSSVTDSARIAKLELGSILLFYLALYMTALMIFNIPLAIFSSNDLLKSIGFVQRVPNGAWLGFPLILYALIAHYWALRRRLIRDQDLPLGAIGAKMTPSELAMATDNGEFSRPDFHRMPSTSITNGSPNSSFHEGSTFINRSTLISSGHVKVTPTLQREISTDSARSLLIQNAWVQAKRVLWYISIPFVRYSHILAMAGLYFSGLTSVNLINAGYVVFFMFAVIVPRRILQKSWLVLILYAEIAISVIYLWQAAWTLPYDDNYYVKLFGLTHYSTQLELIWDEKKRSGLIWHFVILAFSLIQHTLVKVAMRRENRDPLQRRTPAWMTKFFSVMTYIFYRYGILACYAALLLVPTYSKRSFINFIYLFMLFISLNIHMVVKKFDDSLRHLSRFWLVVCTLSAIIFVGRYIAQFAQVNALLQQFVPSGASKPGTIVLIDLGLDADATPLTELLGNAAVLVSTVFQQKSFYRKKDKIPHEPSLKNVPKIRSFLAFLERFMMLYMVNITLLVIMIVALSAVSLINVVYLIIAVICIPLKFGTDNIGLLVMLYTQIIILAKLIYQFPARAGVQQDALLGYFGFKESPNNLLFGGEVAIIALVSIQRIALRWRHDFNKNMRNPLTRDTAMSNSNPSLHDTSMSKIEYPSRLTLFLYDVNLIPKKNFNLYDLQHQAAWYFSNIFQIHKFQFFILSLLIGLFIHEDLMAVVFFIIVVISIRLARTNITRGGPPAKILFAIIALLMLLQYIFTLEIPPTINDRYPWYYVDAEIQKWFLVKTNTINNLITEFFVLMVLSGIINSEEEESEFLKSTYWKTMISSFVSSSIFESGEGWFIDLRFSLLRNSIYWTLLLVFLAGTVEANLLYLGYLIFALIYLYSTNRIYKYRNAHWRYARIYNIIVIFAKLAYQSPLFEANTSADSWSSIVGLKKYNLSEGRNNIFIVFDIVIFIFLSIQKTVLTRAEFGVMVQKMVMEQAEGLEDAMERYEKYLENRALKVKKMKAERLKRRRQLELLKLYRERQQEAWRLAAEGGLSIVDAAKLVDQTSILKTTADIQRLEETGAITYSRDAEGKTIMRLNAPEKKAPAVKRDIPSVDLSKLATPSVVVTLEDEDSDEDTRDRKAENVSAPQSIIPSNITQRFKDLGAELTSRVTGLAGRRRVSGKPDREKALRAAAMASQGSMSSLPKVTSQSSIPTPQTPSSVKRGNSLTEVPQLTRNDSSDISASPPNSDPGRVEISEVPMSPMSQPDELKLSKPTGIGYMMGKIVDQFVKILDRYTYAKLRKYSGRSRVYQLFVSIFQFVATYSQSLVYLVFMLNVLINNDIISLFYVGTMLFYCLLARPRPSKNYWKLVLIYTSIVLIVKFLFQFSIVCMCYRLDSVITYAFAPECYAASCNNDITTYVNNFPILLGLYKYGDAPNVHPIGDLFSFFSYAIMDILVLVAVLIHRHFLKQFGYWNQWQEQYEFENEHLVVQMSKRDKRILQDKRRSLLQIKLAKKMQSWSKFYSLHRREHVAKIKTVFPDRDLSVFDSTSISNPIFDRSLLQEINAEDVGDSLNITNPLYKPELVKDDKGDESSRGGNGFDSTEESEEENVMDKLAANKPLSPRRQSVNSAPKFGISEYLNRNSKFDIDYFIWQDRERDEFVGKSEIKKLGEKLSATFKKVFTSIPKYYRNMFADNPAAVDLYVFMFFAEFLSFFFLIFFPSTVIGTQGLVQFVSTNSIPSVWVWAIFAQFIVIIVDRVLYSYRAIRLKLLMHYVTVVFYHILILFVLPLVNGKSFPDLPELVWFYFFKLVYMVASALQIGYGFPLRVQGQILTKDLETPNPVIMVLFFVYRSIPFVYEIRSILDWTLTSTTLTLMEWLKFEDIFAELFLNKCRIHLDRITTRNVGEPIFWYVKLLMGLGVFSLIVLLLFLPLFLFMQGTSSSVPNIALTVEVSIGFSGFDNIYMTSLTPANGQLNTLTPAQFDNLRRDSSWIQAAQAGGLQVGILRQASADPWSISPQAREELISALNSSTVSLSYWIRWRRAGPETKLWQEFRQMRELQRSEQDAFLNVLRNPNTADSVFIGNFLPRYFDVPQSEPVDALEERGYVSFSFSMNRTFETIETVVNGSSVFVNASTDVWSISEVNSSSAYFNKKTVQFVSLNAEILTGIVSTIAGSGIIGFYVSIVLAVGRFLRIALTNLSHKPIYEDMAECDELLSFCVDIYMAREDKDLELEENLWRELIELYRSPERMILRTDPKGKPRFKSHPVKPKKNKKKLDTPSKAQLVLGNSQNGSSKPPQTISPRTSGDDFPPVRKSSSIGKGSPTKRKLD